MHHPHITKPSAIITFIKDWTLPIAMIAGVIAYFVFKALNLPQAVHSACVASVSVIQPVLLAVMLFVSFCKVSPQDLRPRHWHVILLGLQVTLFLAVSAAAIMSGDNEGTSVLLQGAMLCLICPTATAAAVVTNKLGGDSGSIITYTLMINVATSLLAPAILPLVHPQPGSNFIAALLLIMGHVFPLLVMPLLAAWLVRYLMPKFHSKILSVPNLAFYLWAVSLALAIAVTTKSIVHSTVSLWYLFGLAVVSLICCLFQFWAGKRIGGANGERICGGQAFGQKNTVFIIWLGYTFLTPVTAVVGGFYSVWHNVINSWQLYKHKKGENPPANKNL